MDKTLQEFILATILTILIFFTGINILPFILLFFPVNFIVLGVRHKISYSVLSFAISQVFVYLLGGIDLVISMTLISVIAFPIMICIKKGYNPTKTIAISTGLFVLLQLIIFLAIGSFYEGDVIAEIESGVLTNFEETIKLLEMTDLPLKNLDVNELQRLVKKSLDLMMTIIPALIFIISFAMCLVNYYASSYVLRKYKSEVSTGAFKDFALPADFGRGIFYVFLGTLILSLFNFKLQDELSLNLAIILVSLLTTQGISVVMNIVGARSTVLAVILNIFLLTSTMSFFLTLIGLMEGMFGLRARWRMRNE